MRPTISIIIFAIGLYILNQTESFARSNELEGLLKHKKPIKVFLEEFASECGKRQIDPKDFGSALERSLSNRRSVKFEIVTRPEASDVRISGVIKRYQYLERGPMKFSPSVQGMLLDAAASVTTNYVEMEAEFTIIDTKTNDILWKDVISGYIKRAMMPEESVSIIYDKIARQFLWKAFGKPAQ